jgi:cytochrome c553
VGLRIATWALAALAGSALAAPPKPADTMAQRVRACTACHGEAGRAAADGFHPRIAGKPAGYLFNQLVAFRDGRRPYALMTSLLEPLSDAYLREIAGHFAALDLPYPPPQAPTAAAAALERGRQLVEAGDKALGVPACAACHGERLTGAQPATPGLLGLPRDYLNAQLGAWRSGERRAAAPDCMAKVARALAPEDIAAVAQWLAAQPVPRPSRAVDRLPAALPLDCGGGAR